MTMKFSRLSLLILLFPLMDANAQVTGETSGESPEVVGTLIPTPPELDPELNYCLNVAYQLELRQHLSEHPEDDPAIVRFALLQGLCELVFDGIIDEATAMKLWARHSMK